MKVGPLDVAAGRWQLRHIEGGMLVQQADAEADPESEWKVVTSTQPKPTRNGPICGSPGRSCGT